MAQICLRAVGGGERRVARGERFKLIHPDGCGKKLEALVSLRRSPQSAWRAAGQIVGMDDETSVYLHGVHSL